MSVTWGLFLARVRNSWTNKIAYTLCKLWNRSKKMTELDSSCPCFWGLCNIIEEPVRVDWTLKADGWYIKEPKRQGEGCWHDVNLPPHMSVSPISFSPQALWRKADPSYPGTKQGVASEYLGYRCIHGGKMHCRREELSKEQVHEIAAQEKVISVPSSC